MHLKAQTFVVSFDVTFLHVFQSKHSKHEVFEELKHVIRCVDRDGGRRGIAL